METSKHTLTLYTPCYNKGKTISRTYESLLSQTCHDFEWIIINDGSTDESKEVIDSFQTNLFPIRKIHKHNEGLSSVMNMATQMANGEFILRVDGDDWLVTDGVKTIHQALNDYDMQDQHLGGLVFLTEFADGKRCGFHPFKNPTRCNFMDYREKHKAIGDRAEVFRTSCFREFPMPSFPDERFMLESYTWRHFSDKYDVIYYDTAIYNREYNDASITNNWPAIGIKNPKGIQLDLSDYLNRKISLKNRIKGSVNYYRYSLHSEYSISKLIKDVPITSSLIGFIPGMLLYFIERKHLNFIHQLKNAINIHNQ